jgi:sugar O-acyltransferase (sialic acid O-acetyltransferase NeuD family)
MTRFIMAPLINVNDDHALLSLWTKPDHSLVRKGEVIAVLETSKATIDVESEDAGYLNILVPAGAQVVVGEIIGALCDQPDESPERVPEKHEPEEDRGVERKVTKKAEIAATKASLDLNRIRLEIPGAGTITEADVAGYLKRHGAGSSMGESGGRDHVDDTYPHNRQQRLLLIGGGLGAVQVLDSLSRIEHQRATAIVDDNPDLGGKTLMGVPILGGQESIEVLFKQNLFDAAIVSVSTSITFRQRMGDKLGKLNIPMANVIDPSARVQRNALLGDGNVILAYCQIGACARIGNGNFFSPYVDVEHHCVVEDFCTFGPGVMMSSLVTVGARVKFGTGIFIEPKLTIGPDCIIGSGAILARDIPPNSIVKTKVNYSIRSRSYRALS